MIRAALVALILLLTATAGAQTIQERFQDANGHYYKERYAQARQAYEELIDRYHIDDPVLHYNLGNTYHQLDELGRAVLSYKRALALDPAEELTRRIKDNLELTTRALIDRHRKDVSRSVTVLDETHGVMYSLFNLMSPTATAALFLACWLLFFGVLIARRFVSGADTRRTLRNLAIALAVPWVISMVLFAGNRLTAEAVRRGVIVTSDTQLRDGRHPDAPASDVPEGLEVRIIDTTDPNETRIRLSNGKEGWVPARAVEAI